MSNEALRIDGFEIPILEGSWTEDESELGPIDRAEDSQLRDGVRARPRAWSCIAPFTDNISQRQLANLIRGRGFHVPFDTSYNSDGGLGPNSGYTGCSLGTAAPVPKFGTRRLAITSANSMAYTVTCSQGDTWTIGFWHQVVATGVWTHYVVTKDLTGTTVKYVSGVAGGTIAMHSVSVSGTVETFTITGKNAAGSNFNAWYDGLVMLPWAASAAQVAAWAAQTVAFSPLPQLNLQGILLADSTFNPTIRVRGSIGKTTTVRASGVTNLLAVELKFTEVAPYR